MNPKIPLPWVLTQRQEDRSTKQHTAGTLVSYCCETDHHKLTGLKEH